MTLTLLSWSVYSLAMFTTWVCVCFVLACVCVCACCVCMHPTIHTHITHPTPHTHTTHTHTHTHKAHTHAHTHTHTTAPALHASPPSPAHKHVTPNSAAGQTIGTDNCRCTGSARTTHIRCIHGISGWEITKYSHMRRILKFWPTLDINTCAQAPTRTRTPTTHARTHQLQVLLRVCGEHLLQAVQGPFL